MAFLSDSAWYDHYQRCLKNAKHGKVTRVSAGQYLTRSWKGTYLNINQINEGFGKGWWIVASEFGNGCSEPIPTLKKAKDVAFYW
ncbi:hypothetical protein V0288_04575 [Pannus brasiliensis CCIBt3594]|uniref:Uncharacterized protein n=1 Tax=Pannus brasiliensis CCIBt3594 TaxID=1427578 RepID=A0AAW9QSR9_9CHRO